MDRYRPDYQLLKFSLANIFSILDNPTDPNKDWLGAITYILGIVETGWKDNLHRLLLDRALRIVLSQDEYTAITMADYGSAEYRKLMDSIYLTKLLDQLQRANIPCNLDVYHSRIYEPLYHYMQCVADEYYTHVLTPNIQYDINRFTTVVANEVLVESYPIERVVDHYRKKQNHLGQPEYVLYKIDLISLDLYILQLRTQDG